MTKSPARSGTLQIHVSRRCNLRCLHCYSSSGPEARGSLPLDLLRDAVDDARRLGYGTVSVSGGEPLMYRPLGALARHARAGGSRVAVVTNGMLLDPRRLDPLADAMTAFVVSLDGAPDAHDAMRGHPRAFATMRTRLPHLRAAATSFGFLLTVGRHSLADLEWAAQFARDEGASFLQVHLLSDAGRAGETAEIAGASLTADQIEDVVARASALKRGHAGALDIVVDVQPVSRLASHPGLFVPGPGRMADVVPSLVVEPDGAVVPMCYGLDRRHGLGSLQDARLPDLVRAWMRSGGPRAFRDLCARTRERLLRDPADGRFFDWAVELGREAAAHPVPEPA